MFRSIESNSIFRLKLCVIYFIHLFISATRSVVGTRLISSDSFLSSQQKNYVINYGRPFLPHVVIFSLYVVPLLLNNNVSSYNNKVTSYNDKVTVYKENMTT